jgi:AcrR family transcriptional regulator
LHANGTDIVVDLNQLQTAPLPERQDHRVRVARERRERMRRRLLESVLAVCSGENARAPAVIDDVVQHADVSRGTFYKYFDSIDQAIGELGFQLADEMTAGIAEIYDVLTDPMMRTATGFQLFLIRAYMDPDWGAFIARIGLLREEDLFTSKIRNDIALGIASGDYLVDDIVCASDMLMGAKAEAILRLISKEKSLDYIQSMARHILCAFGVSRAKAATVIERAFVRIVEEGPASLPWWQDSAIKGR